MPPQAEHHQRAELRVAIHTDNDFAGVGDQSLGFGSPKLGGWACAIWSRSMSVGKALRTSSSFLTPTMMPPTSDLCKLSGDRRSSSLRIADLAAIRSPLHPALGGRYGGFGDGDAIGFFRMLSAPRCRDCVAAILAHVGKELATAALSTSNVSILTSGCVASMSNT